MHRTLTTSLLTAACGAALALPFDAARADDAMRATASGASPSTPRGACPARLTHLQVRLLTRAQYGPDALRRFIEIRRAMLQLDIAETQAWAYELLNRCPQWDVAQR